MLDRETSLAVYRYMRRATADRWCISGSLNLSFVCHRMSLSVVIVYLGKTNPRYAMLGVMLGKITAGCGNDIQRWIFIYSFLFFMSDVYYPTFTYPGVVSCWSRVCSSFIRLLLYSCDFGGISVLGGVTCTRGCAETHGDFSVVG